MNEDFASNISRQQVAERFDLLAADAKEYAIFLIGKDGRMISWNPGAERLFGYHSTEIIGHHFSCFFAPDDIANCLPEHELNTALTAGRASSDCWQIRKDGTQFWCQATVTPLRDEHKQIQSFARMLHDLTDTEARHVQMKRADELAEANRNKEEFMAVLSHELRNPLSPILNAVSILRQIRTNDPMIEQAGNIIDRQVVQMVRLVDDLLDISRVTKGKLRLTSEKVELRVIANRAAETARPLMEAREHDFFVSLPTEPVWIHGDPARLEQIIVNLLNNAAKYTDMGGLVRMTVQQVRNEAIIRVRDNGIGIPPDMLPHIFNLFTQVDFALNRSHGGLGIGLALVRTLVEMQEGRVQAQSGGLGKGSEFTVKLPVLPVTSGNDAKSVRKPGKHSAGSLQVLIVEDNVDAGDSLSLLLRLHGHEVQVARTGPAALELAAEYRPDIVLLDIGLPGMDGYEVVQHLREKPEFKTVVVCAVSGYTPTDADRYRHQQMGFDHHFVKPVSVETLLDLFDTVVKQPLLQVED